MHCKKCNEVLPEDSAFCNHCGTKVDNESPRNQEKNRNRKLYIVGGGGALVILLALIVVLFYNNSVSAFKSAVRENDHAESKQIYDSEIVGDLEKEQKVETFLKEELQKIEDEFVSRELEYEAAKTSLETIEKTGLMDSEARSTLSDINDLNDSRIAFQKGQEFLSQKNHKDALSHLNKVIEQDEDYTKAQELIKQSAGEYKKAVLSEAEELAKAKKYGDAANLMNVAKDILPEESEFASKREGYLKSQQEQLAAERKQKMQETAKLQEVVVKGASVVAQSDEYKALWPDMIQVIVHNQSSKAVKSMVVSMLGFDKNGLPTKIKRRFGDASFEFLGNADSVNIVPDSSFGDENGWEIDENHGIQTVLACVKKVEYYDGSKWENPYYTYWIEEYKEKPLHN